jgi:hypothetical protein
MNAWIWTVLLAILVVGVVLMLLLSYKSTLVEGLYWNQRPMDQVARKGQVCRILQRIQNKDSEIQIQLVSPTCEDGLPHTVDKTTIRMTEAVWKSDRREAILHHERVHLKQRQDPNTWSRFYEEFWGYTFPTQIPPEIQTRPDIRSNPDTWDSPFPCWQNRYWFVPVYDNPKQPSLRQTHVEVWDSQVATWTSVPQEWTTHFCGEECPHQYEHPHEIAAEYSTDGSWNTPAARSFYEFQKTYAS